MKERERLIVSGLVLLMLILWLGFAAHRSPDFAGSFWGGVLGVSGALVMLLPLAYLIVKRVPGLKKSITKKVSMRTLLTWHIYAGVLGPILGLLHTGHKFESPLGIALTATMLVVVLSGFIGRYLMNQLSKDIKQKKAALSTFQAKYDQIAAKLSANPEQRKSLNVSYNIFSQISNLFAQEEVKTADTGTTSGIVRLTESISDIETAIITNQQIKNWFSLWLKIHIVISCFLYLLLSLHIWAGIYFGLRWFR